MTAFQPEPFGKYYLVDKIAVGGMAEIFKAKSFSHGGFEKLLVIKRILGHLSDNLEFIEMFIDEAKISVTLTHPNVVQIFDFGKIRDNYYIAMECVEGKDVKGLLRKLAERRKLLPVEFAVYICHEMCKGLDYAHKKADAQGNHLNIIHRDISPSNILVSYQGEVKVADFGIARAENSVHNTRAGVLKGKFEYMSPEQATAAELDARSDVFAAGIILHEMLTGRRLFKTPSEIQTLEKIKRSDVDPPSALNPAIPARLDEIVLRALARDRDDRYVDARAMQTDLLDFMYPATPDLTRESLQHFLQELFRDEMNEEASRLEESSRIASRLWESTPELELDQDWREPETAGDGTIHFPNRLPLLAGAMGAAVLVGVLGLGVYAAVGGGGRPEAGLIPPGGGNCEADFGCLIAVAKPDGAEKFPDGVVPRVLVDGVPVGTGSTVFFNRVPPNKDVKIRVEADGYVAMTFDWNFTPGQTETFPFYLDPTGATTTTGPAANEVAPPPPEPTGARIVRFESTPSGADVLINDERIGRAPMDWTGGSVGSMYEVTFRLDGYADETFQFMVPAGTDPVLEKHALRSKMSPTTRGEGEIAVNCSRGWGEVWIDGKKAYPQTPAMSLKLKEGVHQVQVKNPTTRFDSDVKTIEVKAETKTRHSFICQK